MTVAPGQARLRLSELLRRHHLPLNTRCGQRGLCDGCLVELVAGTVVHVATGREVAAESEPVSLRSCQYRLAGDAFIRISPRALLAHKPQAVSEFRINIPRAHDPLAPAGLGVAVDIGTTTVVVLLVDLTTGKILARAADFNKQMRLGDDVATRIGLCAGDPGMVRQLQEAVLDQTIVPLLAETRRLAGANDIRCLSVAGNTTMLHLFAGVDPTPMGTYPFRPAFLDYRTIQLPALGGATAHLLPSAGAYVGADLTAGALASGLAYDDGPSLLVDVGTNGEVILKQGEHLWGCATAAGPAFEGAGLASGMRAAAGAIERIRFDRDTLAPRTKIIGRTTAMGICGSGYIDLLAEGRRAGLINERGRLRSNGRLELADGVFVTEADIAHLLQAKAATAAGILTLLERVGVTPSQIKTLHLAGGFGRHLDAGNAVACGLLPGFAAQQIQVVGNTSLAGAYLALLDRGALEEMKRIACKLEVVELNLDRHFESRYIDHLWLP